MFEQYHKVQQAILETTLRLINQKELQATSMALLAKESGVSTGNIYHYFQSKEDIINELYKAIVYFSGQFVRQGLDKEGSIRERFYWGWEKVVEFGRQYSQGFQFIEQYSFSPYIHENAKQEAIAGGWCDPMSKLYTEAIEQQLFINMDPKLMVQLHYGSLVYALKGHQLSSFVLTNQTVQTTIQICWNSVSRQASIDQ
ncbi:TetR/AcrR family transcriptional regulator [Cohnella nanjingensis]|uniref:TetR/AcrR family transcriptional regulator n=1 Tax=Cohnella nanjingensis TaxID=1387779 RepID=A0A7X0RX01_9BACL|nr:TetR/AcrR family transcriptional regulator [Cohnella nanjingensis]MBB6675213.1 TetR/AcrR family transcriptional regulator [Cohnella nanjingensis]